MFGDVKNLKENGWTERYTVYKDALYLVAEKDKDKRKHRGTNYFIDPIEVLIDVKTSVKDPQYKTDWASKPMVDFTKLTSEKPGHTLWSLKCVYNCQVKLPNVTELVSVKTKNWV